MYRLFKQNHRMQIHYKNIYFYQSVWLTCNKNNDIVFSIVSTVDNFLLNVNNSITQETKKIIVLEKYIWAIRFHIIEKSLVYLIKQNVAGRILLNDNIRYFIILCNIVYYILRYCITSYYFCIML